MSPSAFAKLDDKPFSRFHVLAMFTTGMGVFTDGNDLSSIGLVLPASSERAAPASSTSLT